MKSTPRPGIEPRRTLLCLIYFYKIASIWQKFVSNQTDRYVLIDVVLCSVYLHVLYSYAKNEMEDSSDIISYPKYPTSVMVIDDSPYI